MALKDLAEWLAMPAEDGALALPALSPRVGAAGLLVAAAHRQGSYTDVERDLAAAALMKLFLIPNPDAKALRREAEDALLESRRPFGDFAAAAGELDRDEQESLLRHLWQLAGHDPAEGTHGLVAAVRDALGFTEQQADALRPKVA